MTTKKLEDIVLLNGKHDSPEAGMCAMEAAAFLANEPFSDHPACACPVLGAAMRALNDSSCWRDDAQRTEVMRPYVARVIGTAKTSVGTVKVRRAMVAADCAAKFNANPDGRSTADRFADNACTLLDALFAVQP